MLAVGNEVELLIEGRNDGLKKRVFLLLLGRELIVWNATWMFLGLNVLRCSIFPSVRLLERTLSDFGQSA